MKQILAAFFALTLTFSSNLLAQDKQQGELIFQDDFERNESQEIKDEVGNGWHTNSKSRAKGNKQVDLKDGAMRIFIHKEADHGVSVTHPAEFKDGSVEMKFMLEDGKDSLGLNFADLEYKTVHAGHLFIARIYTHTVLLQDLKTGVMDQKIRDARKGKTLTAEQKKMLKGKEKRIKNKLETGKWYHLLVQVKGDAMTLSIDGKEVGSFTSEGIAHPTKRTLRLSVPKNAVVDEVRIWKG